MCFFLQAEDGIRDAQESRGLGDVYKRQAPPGEDGVHGGADQPGTQQVPDFAGFISALLGGEEAGDAGEVNDAEGDGEDGSPGDAEELEGAEEVFEGVIGGGEVEHFKSEEGGEDQQPKGKPGANERGEFGEGGTGGREIHEKLLEEKRESEEVCI